jgi:hypothetical protein
MAAVDLSLFFNQSIAAITCKGSPGALSVGIELITFSIGCFAVVDGMILD